MAKEKHKRAFRGIWIPKKLWLDEKLTLQEKVFLAEIDSLDNEEGCYASNGYFARFFGLSKKRVSFIINSLCQKKLIISTIDTKAVNKKRRRLSPLKEGHVSPKTRRPPPRKWGDPLPENRETPSPKAGRQDNKEDNIAEKIEDKKQNFSSGNLSKADAQDRGYQLLIQQGVDRKVARAIVYDHHTPLQSIEETIKNGLAKQKDEKNFTLEPGYIVAALNGARKEGKIVTSTKTSRAFKREIENRQKPRAHLTKGEFAERKRKQLKRLAAAS